MNSLGSIGTALRAAERFGARCPTADRHKELADYAVDPNAIVTDATAAALIADASRSVDRVAALLAPP